MTKQLLKKEFQELMLKDYWKIGKRLSLELKEMLLEKKILFSKTIEI
jgi:hypothetical protein